MGGLSDIIHGKEKKYSADPLARDVNKVGKSGLAMLTSAGNELNDKIYANPDSYVNNQIGIENNLLRSASDDAARRTRQLIASRGMGNSSIGLGQQVNQQRTLNEKLQMNNASGMERLKALLGEKMQTGNQLFNPKASQGPMQMTPITARSGGFGALIGPALQAGAAYYGAKS